MSVAPQASADRVTDAQIRFTGFPVRYNDEHRVEHIALITHIHNVDEEGIPNYINLVFVVDDEAKYDQYGRQIDRATSVPREDSVGSAGRSFYIDTSLWP